MDVVPLPSWHRRGRSHVGQNTYDSFSENPWHSTPDRGRRWLTNPGTDAQQKDRRPRAHCRQREPPLGRQLRSIIKGWPTRPPVGDADLSSLQGYRARRQGCEHVRVSWTMIHPSMPEACCHMPACHCMKDAGLCSQANTVALM